MKLLWRMNKNGKGSRYSRVSYLKIKLNKKKVKMILLQVIILLKIKNLIFMIIKINMKIKKI